MSRTPLDERSRRRRRLIITLTAAGLIIAALAGIGIYGLIKGPTTTPGGSEDAAPSATTGTDPTGVPRDEALPSLPRTNDPVRYVTAVAQALFTWDTFTLYAPSDYRGVLIEDADPSGTETPGLISDLDGYFPSADTWRELAEYRTAQTLVIDRVFVPEQWSEAVAAGGDQIADGTVAYTVEGTRHREGVWYDDRVSSDHRVAFTVFVTCAPTFDWCRLLRLSEPDNPLR